MAASQGQTQAPVMETWNDVSAALAQMGKLTREMERITLEAQEGIDAIKEAAREQLIPMEERVKALERQLKKYATAHRDELGDRKSKDLYYGSVAFRETRKVRLPGSPAALAEVVIRLKARGMDECIKTYPDSVLREPLSRYPGTVVHDVGASLVVEDKFSYEIHQDKLSD